MFVKRLRITLACTSGHIAQYLVPQMHVFFQFLCYLQCIENQHGLFIYLTLSLFVFNNVYYDYQVGRNLRPYTTRKSFSWCIKKIFVSVIKMLCPGWSTAVEMQMESLQVLNCLMFVFPDNPLQISCEEVSYASVNGSLEQAPNYILHVYPPAILHNYLPYNIRYATQVSTVNFSFRSSFGRKTPL